MATANFKIKPGDGWTAVTSAGVSFIRIRSSTYNCPFYVTSGAGVPPASTIGFKVDCNDFCCDVPVSDNFYVRTIPGQPESNTISIFSVPSA